MNTFLTYASGLLTGLFLDWLRRRYTTRDARQKHADQLAIELIEYDRKLRAARVLFQNPAARRLAQTVGEAHVRQQIQPHQRLLDLVAPEHLPLGIPHSEALRATFNTLGFMATAAAVIDQRTGGTPASDATVDEALGMTDRLLELIGWMFEQLRPLVSTRIRERLDPETLGQSQRAENLIMTALPVGTDNDDAAS